MLSFFVINRVITILWEGVGSISFIIRGRYIMNVSSGLIKK